MFFQCSFSLVFGLKNCMVQCTPDVFVFTIRCLGPFVYRTTDLVYKHETMLLARVPRRLDFCPFHAFSLLPSPTTLPCVGTFTVI